MEITVNGKTVSLNKEININELLQELKVETPEYVTVQINEEIIGREDFQSRIIRDGDSVEFLYFMGGGAL